MPFEMFINYITNKATPARNDGPLRFRGNSRESFITRAFMNWRVSVTKSTVFPRNWATLTPFPRDVFHVHGLKRPQ